MFSVVTGGSASGKSAYAENEIMKLKEAKPDARLIYLATMVPYGEDTRQRIQRHIGLRAGKGFETVECFGGLKELGWNSNDIVLLECMSNLLADEIYEKGNPSPVEDILEGISRICNEAAHLVVVTNEIFSDGIPYEADTVRYINFLGEINRRMAAMADNVTEVVCGIPVPMKNRGEENNIWIL